MTANGSSSATCLTTSSRTASSQVDRRAYVYYMALGNSPAMMAKNIGVGSYYLWAYRDADGDFLDGAKSYKLHIPANVPAKDFWSVLVYDSLSRSELKNDQKFPSVSKYTDPKINADGSVDVYFGPKCRKARTRTGSRPFPARAGSRSSASTARFNRSTTRAGS